MLFDKISIIGVGLIGASFALASKQHGISRIVSGYGRNEANLKRAQGMKIIDNYSLSLRDLSKDADLIVLCSPVGTFLDLVKDLSPCLEEGTIITDVGSVKGSLVYELEDAMPGGAHFVGSHPIKGNEKSGIDAASGSLFQGATCIVTPTEKTDRAALKRVTETWEIFGSRVLSLTPELHDRILSSVSHLPHIIAYALVNTVDDINSEFLRYSGSGFIDTTRIAMSSPEIWRDICMLNRDNISHHIKIFKQELDHIAEFLHTLDKEALQREFGRARSLRKTLNKNGYNQTA